MHNILDLSLFFEKYKGKKILYRTNPGNAGDALIGLGTIHFFNSINLEFEFFSTNSIIDSDTILIYAGGGNLVSEYNTCANFINENYEKAKEIIVLPHSINGHKELLLKVQDKVSFICRELFSYKYLTEDLKLKNVYLSKDMAFYLDLSKVPIEKYKKNRLIYFPSKDLNKAVLNINLRFLLRKIQKDKLFAYRVDKEKTNIQISKNNFDVSALFIYRHTGDIASTTETVAEFLGFLSNAEIIYTNRLHVSIGSALLGKKVYLKNNSYYKNYAIYEFSIKDNFPNVIWDDIIPSIN